MPAKSGENLKRLCIPITIEMQNLSVSPPPKLSRDTLSTPTRPTRKRVRSDTKGVVKPCKCGSTTHSRITHKDCPYKASKSGGKMPTVTSRNRELKNVDEESVYSEDEEGMVSDMDVFVVSSADEDDDIQLCTSWVCTCSHMPF